LKAFFSVDEKDSDKRFMLVGSSQFRFQRPGV